jgi:PTS system nitrogen regulatory IIA component
MVMAAGYSQAGIGRGEGKPRVHYVFVIGVPVTMAADYLRIVGALARIFIKAEDDPQLLSAGSAQEFIDLLARREMEL